jgi:hypothetical protein
VEAGYPDPGVVEYTRPVGSVGCLEGHEGVSVNLVQREENGRREPVQLVLHGMRWAPGEAELLIAVLRSGLGLMAGASAVERTENLGDPGQGR